MSPAVSALITAIAVLIPALVLLYRARSDKGNAMGQAAVGVAQAAAALITPLQDELARNTARVVALEKMVHAMQEAQDACNAEVARQKKEIGVLRIDLTAAAAQKVRDTATDAAEGLKQTAKDLADHDLATESTLQEVSDKLGEEK